MKNIIFLHIHYIAVCFVLGITLCFTIPLYNSLNKQNYMDVNGIVIKKYGQDVSHRKSHRITTDFIMIVKMFDGHCFDLKVSPTTYVLFEEGEYISFPKLNKYIIYSDHKDKSFLLLILNTIILVIFIILLIAIFTSIVIDYSER